MKKYFLLLILTIPGFLLLKGQTNSLQVEGETGSLYLTHTVSPKQTWYGIGRIYNLSPKDIAAFNDIVIDKPLAVGETLKIPLTSENFSQDGSKATDEVFVPVYHIIKEKEWFYRISVNHNKVPLENLEKWNNIAKDDAKAGMKLIVGYLKVKRRQSSLAVNGMQTVESPGVTQTVVKETVAVKDDEIKARKEDARKQPIFNESKNVSTVNFNGGYFKSLYEETGKFASGISGVFKSTSGWSDGKYYALMNHVPVGTIVKIDGAGNRTIYAKVLGQLPEMKESIGLTIRISDAAATELGASNTKFSVDVRY